jgi:hypothetical protein
MRALWDCGGDPFSCFNWMWPCQDVLVSLRRTARCFPSLASSKELGLVFLSSWCCLQQWQGLCITLRWCKWTSRNEFVHGEDLFEPLRSVQLVEELVPSFALSPKSSATNASTPSWNPPPTTRVAVSGYVIRDSDRNLASLVISTLTIPGHLANRLCNFGFSLAWCETGADRWCPHSEWAQVY